MSQKTAVVLGGTGLLGYATVQELVKHGGELRSMDLSIDPAETKGGWVTRMTT